MTLPELRFGTDSSDYEKLYQAAIDTLPLGGASIEFGVREGGSAELIMHAALAHGMPRVHVGVDPWGGLPYRMGTTTTTGNYSDDQRRECLANLYPWAKDSRQDLLMFAMKDTDFFDAFPHGVPFYKDGIARFITQYSLVVFDAEHVPEAILPEVAWAASRTMVGGQWVFDDTDVYEHIIVDRVVIANGFTCLTTGHKTVYQKL